MKPVSRPQANHPAQPTQSIPVAKSVPVAPAEVRQEDEPIATTAARWRWWWMFGLLIAVGLLAGASYLAHRHQLQGVELTVFHFINNWPEKLRYPFLVASLAPEGLWLAVASVLLTFLVRMYRLAWQLAVATVGGYGLAYIVQHVVHRARPIELTTAVHARIHEVDLGFPSGHTMILTIIVLIVWPYLPRGWRWLTVLLIPLMALSRLYLGVHAPLDVVGGFAIGLLVVSAMRVLPAALRQMLRFD